MATYRYAEFPECQPFKFQKENDTADPNIHSLPIDKAFFKNRLAYYPYEAQVNYLQKWENADTWIIEWSAETLSGASVSLFNACTGEDMLLAGTGQHTTIAGNLAPNGNPLRTEHWVGNFIGIPSGIYYMKVLITFNDTPDFDVNYISEPIYIADSHPDTKILRYTNSFNKFGIFPEQFPSYFGMRVEGKVYDLQPNSNDTQYEDEITELTLLNSDPFRSWTFAVRNVPDWMLDKVNRVLSMDSVFIDSIEYTKDKDTKLAIIRDINYSLYGASISVRPKGENGVAIFATPTVPPPFACTNAPTFNGMFMAPWPDYNVGAHNNDGGIDRSIVKIVVDPSTSGLDLGTIVYSDWLITGSDGTPISLVQNRNFNFYQRGLTSMENGHSTITASVKLTDANGCSAITGLVINFAISPPYTPNEGLEASGTGATGDFVGFTISNITSTTFDIDLNTPNPLFWNVFNVGFDGTNWVSVGNIGPVTIGAITPLTPDTEYNVYVTLPPAPFTTPLPSNMGPFNMRTLP